MAEQKALKPCRDCGSPLLYVKVQGAWVCSNPECVNRKHAANIMDPKTGKAK